MNIRIRSACIDDLDSIFNLISELEENNVDRDYFITTYQENIQNKNIYYLVAETTNIIVGFISLHMQFLLHHKKVTGEIQELIVSEKYRNKSIGKKLVDEVEKIAHELNLEEIELTTRISRNQAQIFYQNLGFKHTHNKYVKLLGVK